MLLSLSVAGIPHVGADVGGFFGNPDEQLLTRWYQVVFWKIHSQGDICLRTPKFRDCSILIQTI